jgi:glycosyltransferase involved in cell wall biosynthesis
MIRMNILVLCNIDLENKWGDYTRVFSLMQELTKRGHKIFLFIIKSDIKKPRVSYFNENGIEIIEIHPYSIGFSGKKGISRHINYLISIPTIIKEASKIISKHNIDYVYSYMPGTGSSLPAIKIKSKFKIPLILDLADMYSMIRPKRIIDKSFNESDKILVITDYLKQDLLQKGIPHKKIFQIPNGVDFEIFNPSIYNFEEIKSLRNSFDADKVVVFSGSLQDLNILINSAKNIIKKIPTVKFIIIGDHRISSKSKNSWEKIVKKKNLEKYFKFLGKKPKEDIPKYLLCADVCVDSFPNEPYFAAALPIKLLEYGACKKPVVATNVSETAKIISHGKFGYLAEPDNYLEYGEFIIKLLSNPEKAQEMGQNFYEFVRQKYQWEEIVNKLEQILVN